MQITVTQDNIDQGRRGSPMHCPIANAFKDKDFLTAFVFYGIVKDYLAKKNWCTHKRVIAFMHNFDQGLPVQPTTFRLKEGV